MTDYKKIIDELIEEKLLPNKEYLSLSRFTTPYADSSGFLLGVEQLLPMVVALSGAYACWHAVEAIWATLRAVGDFLILKPADALNALHDSGFHLALSIALVVMAPVNLLLNALELLTRTISSWFSGAENTATLSELGMMQVLSQAYENQGTRLPSSNYFTSSRFFSPYESSLPALNQFAAPAVTVVMTGLNSLLHALVAVFSALDCIANLIICKPRHALEDAGKVGIHLSLALALAVMTPINALVEGIAFVSRLGATGVDACKSEEFAAPAAYQP